MSYAEPGCDYGWKCEQCKTGRRYGAARLKAELEAGKHARRYDTHTVHVTETRITHTFTARDNMQPLLDPENTENAPF